MGCVQGKSSSSKSPELDKLKSRYGYVSKRDIGVVVGPRRSTGQRFPYRETIDGSFQEEEEELSDGSPPRDGKLLIGRENEERQRNGNVSKRINVVASMENDNDNDDDKEFLSESWPKWLVDNVPNRVLAGLVPKSAESYDKLDKVGQGTYSNVYKARDRDSGKIVALKKVRFDTSDPESIKFMAREITMLRKLDHPNIVKLEGLATSRMQYSIYLVFDFMPSDLARMISRPERLTEPQVKCYMSQLLSGLEHCHGRGILHRDIKGSNLLIDRNGTLKIADFGLANFYSTNHKRPLTNRVVTLWYRSPELLLGATDYGVGIDLWSAGCLLAEMFWGRPIMPGRTEVEQLHRIFKLCGTPSQEYWRKLKLVTTFRPPQMYKPALAEVFGDFPSSSLGLLKTLLSLDPMYRGSASSALHNEFFSTSPLACDISGLPVIPNNDFELYQARVEKKKRRSRIKRSQTHAVLKITDSEKPEDLVTSKEVKDIEIIISESNTQTEEQSSTTSGSTSFGSNPARLKDTTSRATTSSTSSSSNLFTHTESPLFSISPIRPSNQKTSTVRSQRFSETNNQNEKKLPPLPTKPQIRITNYTRETTKVHKESHIQRSVSTREFRSVNQRYH